MKTALYIAAMAIVTYLIRMIPFTSIRGKIRSRFIRSFLYYIPYTVLAAMTIPAIFFSTGDARTAAVGAAAAFIMSYFGLPLTAVAFGASAAAFVASLIF